MKQIKTIFAAVVCVLLVYGCSVRSNTSLCQIQEVVYHDEWKTCGELVVRDDGHYSYTICRIWDSHPSNSVFNGTLPSDVFGILRKSVSSSDGFAKTNGIPTYKIGIDDTMTRHPEGVLKVLAFVHAIHTPTAIEEKKE